MNAKKIIPLLLLSGAISFGAISCKSGLSDDDLESKIENALTGHSTVDVEVEKGVVTLSGTVNSQEELTNLENVVKTAGAKDLKSVVNNLIVNPPVGNTTAPIIVNSVDEALNVGIKDAIKDFPTVTAVATDGVIKASGTLEQAHVQHLKMVLDKLNPKRVDLSGLTIK